MDGSHSEIEVSSNKDWDAQKILDRGTKLLEFMSKRWVVPFTEEQKRTLLHIDFVNDQRPIIPELKPEPIKNPQGDIPDGKNKEGWTKQRLQRYDFWYRFVEYCNSIGRSEDIARRKPSNHGWYDVSIGCSDYYAFFQILGYDELVSGLYVVQPEAFTRLEGSRSDIEAVYGSTLEWDRSPKYSKAKRIVRAIHTDLSNPQLYSQHFDWMIARFDDLIRTLETCDAEAFNNGKENESILEINRVAYKAAKRVYEGDLNRFEGVREIVGSTGMNEGTAGDFIQGFLAMMNNERYTRTLTEKTTRFYLENILADYGEESLRNAVNACRMHAEYYGSLGYGKLRYVEKIIKEYSDR